MKPLPKIYPPRATSAIPVSEHKFVSDLGWRAQWKFNDTHILIKSINHKFEVWNRHNVDITQRISSTLLQEIPLLFEKLQLDPAKYNVIDGGWLEKHHKAVKNHIVLWDILVRNDNYLLGSTYQSRYQSLKTNLGAPIYFDKLVEVGNQLTDHIFVTNDLHSKDSPAAWEQVVALNKSYEQPLLEGLVFKDYQGILESGYKEKNNSSWLMRCRVTTKRHQF